MKLKSKLKCLLMMFIMTLILSFGSSAFAAGMTLHWSPGKIEPYEWNSRLFCIYKGKGLWVKNVNGMDLASRELTYAPARTIKAEQSIAFAFYTAQKYGWDCPAIQQVVWASGQFSGLPNYAQTLEGYKGHTTRPDSSNAIEARSNQYASFYYGILNGGEKLNFTTENDNSKVLVDYNEQTYTVGPYKIDVNTGKLPSVIKDAKTIFYNELTGINEKNYPKTPEFASYEITGLNGENAYFVDKSGKRIEFPNWGEEFYIRYNPTDEALTINPKIKIHYVSRVDADVTVYEGAEESFSGEINNLWVKKSEFSASDYVKEGTLSGHVAPLKDLTVTALYTTTYEDEEYVTGFKYKAKISNPGDIQPTIQVLTVVPVFDDAEVDLGVKDVSIEFGGNVWVDLPGIKLGNFTGVKSEEDAIFAGMQVQLFDEKNNLVNATTTDDEGKYHFDKLNPLKKYYVKFTYNGQLYQNTYYKNNLTGGYSNAMEENREEFNNRFGKIDSTPQNYQVDGKWHRAYALHSKLAKENGEYIENGTNQDGVIKALTYQDAWNEFLKLAISTKSYDKAYIELENWLRTKEVGKEDINGVITFIQDCMITATTLVVDPLNSQNGLVKYPVYDQFVEEDLKNPPDEVETLTLDKTYYYLYTKKSDQSRYIDFGINVRTSEELYLQKDVYKATVVVNGRKHDYIYSKKNLNEDGSWSVEVRASDELYNGAYSYSREVRKSDYLYDGQESGNSAAKNLQVYVTYRIAVKNRSSLLYSSVNEIVDYYDADQYTFDGTLNSDGTYTSKSYNNYDESGNVTDTYVNSYLGSDGNGTKQGDITISSKTSFADREESKTITNGNYKYNSLYITGIKSTSGSDRLAPGEIAYAYVTFKANTDPATGKVKLDQDLNTGNVTVGKRNIAEINGYSTYYSENHTVPGYLNEDNSTVDTSVANKTAGIVDTLSNSGSLEEIDLKDNGDLRSSKDSEVDNRLEMDTDKAPNLKVVISQEDDDIRRMSGYVFEDERTITNDKAVVGDGKYEASEPKINGVTVELVELVQNVDENGIFLGSYSGERVWGTNVYAFGANGIEKVREDTTRYFSGNGKSKVIITGPGILNVTDDDIGENNGTYLFKSIPAGNFFIRFTYGDDKQTVLTNSVNEVNTLLRSKRIKC